MEVSESEREPEKFGRLRKKSEREPEKFGQLRDMDKNENQNIRWAYLREMKWDHGVNAQICQNLRVTPICDVTE